MWVVTELDWENFLLQMLHLNGFSPEWVLQWAVRLAAWLKDLLHWEHLEMTYLEYRYPVRNPSGD